jgi:hypothetical protein
MPPPLLDSIRPPPPPLSVHCLRDGGPSFCHDHHGAPKIDRGKPPGRERCGGGGVLSSPIRDPRLRVRHPPGLLLLLLWPRALTADGPPSPTTLRGLPFSGRIMVRSMHLAGEGQRGGGCKKLGLTPGVWSRPPPPPPRGGGGGLDPGGGGPITRGACGELQFVRTHTPPPTLEAKMTYWVLSFPPPRPSTGVFSISSRDITSDRAVVAVVVVVGCL